MKVTNFGNDEVMERNLEGMRMGRWEERILKQMGGGQGALTAQNWACGKPWKCLQSGHLPFGLATPSPPGNQSPRT